MPGQEVLEEGDATTLNQIERWVTAAFWVGLIGGLLSLFGCARMPYTVRTVHEDQRVVVTIQREVKPAGYSHPVQLSAQELGQILSSFSFRAKQRLPLRWFAEEVPPKTVFRQDELEALAPFLAEALQKVGPDERVHFQVLAPGMNPAYERDTTGGWIFTRSFRPGNRSCGISAIPPFRLSPAPSCSFSSLIVSGSLILLCTSEGCCIATSSSPPSCPAGGKNDRS